LVILASAAGAAGQMRRSGVPSISRAQVDVPAERLPRLQRWLKAVDRHEPGADDDSVIEVGAWTNTELRGLWVDANVLAQLMRNVRGSRFLVQAERQSGATEIRYTQNQLGQLRALACAAGGMMADPECGAIKAPTTLDADLVRLAQHVVANRLRTGDDNY